MNLISDKIVNPSNCQKQKTQTLSNFPKLVFVVLAFPGLKTPFRKKTY